MIVQGLMAAAALSLGVYAGAAALFNGGERPPAATAAAFGGSLALAPMSLGNPVTAATFAATAPAQPTDKSIEIFPVERPLTVAPGDTLSRVLTRAGVARDDAEAAVRILSKKFDPRRLRAGQNVFMTMLPKGDGSATGEFLGISVEPDYSRVIGARRDGGDGAFRAYESEKSLDHRTVRAAGVIETSLYVAAKKAGVPASVLAELIRIYSWDVDFQRSVRDGDHFEVMFDEARDRRGEVVYNGEVIYAKLTLSGEELPLYRFEMAGGGIDYFNAKGHGARKALLRTPIDGARLSSGFGKRRHPILGYTKMHQGTDFAARAGTPIYAGGDGVDEQAGRNGGYGNYIRIRHNGSYATAYAHMRGFKRGIRSGKRVRQGEIIGYVGTSGRSTGPHLHYEILKNGRQTNPMQVRMPSGKTLAGANLQRFLAARKQLDERFAALGPRRLATAD